jgi:hypothetical protein
LPIADEVRPQRDTERPVAEDKAALALSFGERLRALVGEPGILEELVVRDQRVARGFRAPPCQRT